MSASAGSWFAPVRTTSRPPSGRRRKAERICRTVASRMVRSMPGEAEKGGFISTVVGLDRGVEIVVDLLGVEVRDRRLREQARQQPMTRFGKLVQRKPGAGDFGMDGEKAGAGRGFEQKLARRQLSGERHQESEAERRRELLELVAFLGAARMRGQQRRKLPDHRERAGGPPAFFRMPGPYLRRNRTAAASEAS